jgi:hypothetical protein
MFAMSLVIIEAIVAACYKFSSCNHLISAAGSRLLWVHRAGRCMQVVAVETHLTCAYKRGWKGCCVL